MAVVVFVLLACVADIGLSLRTAGTDGLAQVTSHPQWGRYKRDCGKKVPMGRSFAQFGAELPGAGMHPEELTGGEVLKDGFWLVDCVKDTLLEHGDKFGGNAASYKLGLQSNVSIVRYLEHVPKEDQNTMTHQVCFEFCRSVPLMGFFGLAHGRDCYCAPYYQAMAGDSSTCDAVCEGEPTTMCGGMSKSSVFQMHTCGDTAGELDELDRALGALAKHFGKIAKNLCRFAGGLQESANGLQKTFGQAGDPEASALMQGAKGSASDLRAACKDAKAKIGGIEGLMERKSALTGRKGFDLANPKVMAQAEAIIQEGNSALHAGRDAQRETIRIMKKLRGLGLKGTLKSYVPVTYLIDKKFESAPSTCGGTTIGMPIVAGSPETCAGACDDHVQECDGFSFFAGGNGPSLCFLLSKITSTQYYTGCKSGKASLFLQSAQPTPPAAKTTDTTPGMPTPPVPKSKGPTPPPPKSEGPTPPVPKDDTNAPKSAPPDTKCYAKFQNFEGHSIKPDPSGKCESCLKTATNADRCFE